MPKLQWELLPIELKQRLAQGSPEAAEMWEEEQRKLNKFIEEELEKYSAIKAKSDAALEAGKAALERLNGCQTEQPSPEAETRGSQPTFWDGEILETVPEQEEPEREQEVL